MSTTEPGPDPVPTPVIRIHHGSASAEELAGITVLFAALGDGGNRSQAGRQGWSHRRRSLNPGALRGSGWGGPS